MSSPILLAIVLITIVDLPVVEHVPTARPGWEISSGGLHYQEAGNGKPVVLVHGAGLDSRMWNREMQALSSDWRVLRYDLRGFGRSAPSIRHVSHVDDLEELLDELGIASVTIVGLSMGGGVALDFALARPGRLDGLVLVAPAVSGWERPPEIGAEFIDAFRAAADHRFAEAAELWLRTPAVRVSNPDPHVQELLREMVQDNIMHLMARPRGDTTGPPAFDALESVAPRTMVITGTNDAEDLRRLGRILADRIPCAEHVEIAGAGHVANLDAPERFLQSVRRFMFGVSRE